MIKYLNIVIRIVLMTAVNHTDTSSDVINTNIDASY